MGNRRAITTAILAAELHTGHSSILLEEGNVPKANVRQQKHAGGVTALAYIKAPKTAIPTPLAGGISEEVMKGSANTAPSSIWEEPSASPSRLDVAGRVPGVFKKGMSAKREAAVFNQPMSNSYRRICRALTYAAGTIGSRSAGHCFQQTTVKQSKGMLKIELAKVIVILSFMLNENREESEENVRTPSCHGRELECC